jgi:hypothetical protein
MSDYEANQRAVEQIRTADSNGKGYKQGDWLALLDGKVIAIASELDAAVRALRALDANPQRGMVVEYGNSEIDVIRCV